MMDVSLTCNGNYFTIQTYLVLWYFTLLCFTYVAFLLENEGKILYKQNNYHLLYCDICFTAVFCNQACNISEVDLYM